MAAELSRAIPVTTNRAPIYALLLASAISNVGNMLTMIALPWFVLETTGSAAMTGVVGFFVALPNFLAGMFGGTLVDRLGYKRVSIIADLVSGFGVLMVPLLYLTTGIAFWQLLVLVFIGALLDIPGITSRRAMLPELTRLGGLRLEQVNSAFESVQYLALLLGPPLAGVLIGWLGAQNVLWLDAATFAVSALLVAVAVPAPVQAARAAGGRYLDELKAGLRFLRADQVLFSMAVAVGLSNFLGASTLSVIYPVFVKEEFGRASVLGILAAAFGVGGLLGAVIYGLYGHQIPRRAMWITSFLAFPFTLLAPLLTSSLPVLLTILFLTSIVAGPINAMMVTVRHERIPQELRGRVFSTFSAITAVATPLGILLSGYLVEAVGLDATLLTIVVPEFALAAATVVLPAFHLMDATRGRSVHGEAA
ncbi:MAG TPA: MFS transporter [Thermomicrobiales bacterium]|nr:MFS transporter [Thermomicrobiales bacterium]